MRVGSSGIVRFQDEVSILAFQRHYRLLFPMERRQHGIHANFPIFFGARNRPGKIIY